MQRSNSIQSSNQRILVSTYGCLAYFDIFNYPLTLKEVYRFSRKKTTASEVAIALNQLVKMDFIVQQDQFYLLKENNFDLQGRIIAESRAIANLENAIKYGQKIGRFPFVQCVFITGSLSKGILYEDDGYDYFLIIKKNRLWITNLFLKLFMIIRKSNNFLSIKYLIAEDHLEIDQKNIYIATELKTIIPITGDKTLISKFQQSNQWTNIYLPNKKWYPYKEHVPQKGWITTIIQLILDNPFGSLLDNIVLAIVTLYNMIRHLNPKSSSFFKISPIYSRQYAQLHHKYSQTDILKAYSKKTKLFKDKLLGS